MMSLRAARRAIRLCRCRRRARLEQLGRKTPSRGWRRGMRCLAVMFGLELVPQSANRRRVGDSDRLDGCGRLEARVSLDHLHDPAKLDPVVETAASGSAAARKVGRHDQDPSITIRFTGILMNFASLCQGEKRRRSNRKVRQAESCCEKDSRTCMPRGTNPVGPVAIAPWRNLLLRRQALGQKAPHAGEVRELHLGPRAHLADDLRCSEAAQLPRRLEIEVPGQAE